jgi:hypothetical protein
MCTERKKNKSWAGVEEKGVVAVVLKVVEREKKKFKQE